MNASMHSSPHTVHRHAPSVANFGVPQQRLHVRGRPTFCTCKYALEMISKRFLAFVRSLLRVLTPEHLLVVTSLARIVLTSAEREDGG